MRIYLDEDMASALLLGFLRKAGHDVETPGGSGLMGRSDPAQFAFSIRAALVCLTANHDDYEELHLLLQAAQGNHLGIFVVRRDNDPTRDLSPKGIVNAIRKLEAANAPIRDECIVLNQWR